MVIVKWLSIVPCFHKDCQVSSVCSYPSEFGNYNVISFVCLFQWLQWVKKSNVGIINGASKGAYDCMQLVAGQRKVSDVCTCVSVRVSVSLFTFSWATIWSPLTSLFQWLSGYCQGILELCRNWPLGGIAEAPFTLETPVPRNHSPVKNCSVSMKCRSMSAINYTHRRPSWIHLLCKYSKPTATDRHEDRWAVHLPNNTWHNSKVSAETKACWIWGHIMHFQGQRSPNVDMSKTGNGAQGGNYPLFTEHLLVSKRHGIFDMFN